MIKAPMVTDCRLGIYRTDVFTGLQRGHNAMFLVEGAGAPSKSRGHFREKRMTYPLSCDEGDFIFIYFMSNN